MRRTEIRKGVVIKNAGRRLLVLKTVNRAAEKVKERLSENPSFGASYRRLVLSEASHCDALSLVEMSAVEASH
jgi:hypothetical protein